MKRIEDYVISIPDFPEPGIIFRDVTSILQDADGLALAIDSIREMLKDLDYDVVVGPESRGFIFGDITGILRDADGLKLSIDKIQEMLEGVEFDAVLGLESRGFIFGMPIAYNLHKAFIPVRKKGKLPRETVSAKYDLEYGTAEIEIHKEDLRPGMKVVIIDDLIATGGTVEAAVKLAESLGAEVVKIAFVMELAGLKGRERLAGYDVESVITYEGK